MNCNLQIHEAVFHFLKLRSHPVTLQQVCDSHLYSRHRSVSGSLEKVLSIMAQLLYISCGQTSYGARVQFNGEPPSDGSRYPHSLKRLNASCWRRLGATLPPISWRLKELTPLPYQTLN